MRWRRIGLALATVAAATAAPAAASAQAPEVTLSVAPRHLGGESWRASGSVVPAVAGEPLQIRVSRGGRLLQARTVRLDEQGRFALRLRGRAPGSYRVVAMHGATAAMPYGRSPRHRVAVHRAAAGPGARGFVVRKLQARLRAAGYVPGARGRFDARTARAVLALRKTTGMARVTYASPSVFRRLYRGGGRFRVRHPSHGRHIETDLSRQVMALIGSRGRVQRIYPISSGAPATPTIIGNFRVYRRDYGTNSLGMIHSSYFRGGYAIHGYKSVPVYPASHGCLRVPPDDAWSIYKWIRHGTRVDVYP